MKKIFVVTKGSILEATITESRLHIHAVQSLAEISDSISEANPKEVKGVKMILEITPSRKHENKQRMVMAMLHKKFDNLELKYVDDVEKINIFDLAVEEKKSIEQA